MRTFSALLLFGVSACLVSAKNGLSLSFTQSKSLKRKPFSISTTISNTGDETLKLLRDPRGLLSSMPTDKFIITTTSEKSPKFAGALVKYSPSRAVQANKPDSFIILEPGKSLTIEHDLSKSYNFDSSGAGTYTIEARDVMHHYVDSHAQVLSLKAATAKYKITVPKPTPRYKAAEKRAEVGTCSETQVSLLQAASHDAHQYAVESFTLLNSTGPAPAALSARYITWFNNGTLETVLAHFHKLHCEEFTTFIYDCSCTDAGIYAYVYRNRYPEVFLCGAFWAAPALGTDSKAGTLIHEATHFTQIAGTNDYAYGQSACRRLATSSPQRAIINADSHEYFAENTPNLS